MTEKRLPSPFLIAAIGDSTTAGTPGFKSPVEVPSHGEGNLESQFAYWLMQAHPEWRVLNRGVNGERSDQIRARFGRDALAAAPDVVVIIAGVNDIYQGRSSDEVVRELQAMYELAAAHSGPEAHPLRRHPPVVAGTILPYNTATAEQNRRMQDVNRWIHDYAMRHPEVIYCDTRAAVASPDSPDLLASSPDGLHPSPDGYRLVAAALEPAIRRALARRQALL